MAQTSQANLLDQVDFNNYTTSWVNLVKAGSSPDLEALFQQSSRLLSATLPSDQLLQLVSAVGVRRIKVGFVVQPTAPQDESAFTLVLYAADADNNRLSAYYLANTLWATPAASGTPPAPASGCAMPVPAALASLWQQQWTAATSIEASYFQVPGGVLQGYQFEVADFVQALLVVPQLDDKKLRLDFGLHELYGPNAPGTPGLTRTFGVVVYLADSHDAMVSAPYDLAMPHPPAVSCAD